MTHTTLRKARKAAGLTQAQAAKLLNMSVRTWEGWEQGHRQMPRHSWELFQIKLASK